MAEQTEDGGRRVIASTFVTLDGYMVGPDEDMSWVIDELSPAEGKEDPRIIRALNDSPKLVFSRTLEGSEWSNTRVVGDGLEDEIRALRRQPGKAVGIQGSASIVQALGRADLVDEYRLFVHPVMLGGGTPLFAGDADRRGFELTALKRYGNGVVAMNYSRKVA
jgi:dihydrofolate reductase